jgi:glycosyltransferase involved in cell wall biosynthesis
MKIAHLSAHYRPIIGGQEVYISNLIEVCRRTGHESMVYQLFRGQTADDAYCIPRLKFFARFVRSLDRRWLNWVISAIRPKGLFGADAIIAHYAFHAAPLESVCNKVIVLSHGVEWRVENQDAADRQCEANAKRCLGRFVHVVNDTHYLRRLGLDVEPGRGFFEELAPDIWFIPNCVDTGHFIPGPGLPEYKGRKMILVPRQMVEARGIHLAIQAFAILAKEDPDLEMCLLGKRHKGAARYIERLDRLIADFQLQDRVYFRDPVPNLEMTVWFNSAQVVLIPTLEKEGTSLSAIESMSCGIATVSTNVAGLADLPTIQCDPNPAAVADALREALSDPGQIGNRQRKVVQDVFNLNKWSKAWLTVISRVGSLRNRTGSSRLISTVHMNRRSPKSGET